MKSIVFTEPKKVEIWDEPVPEIKDGQVQVKAAFHTISSGTERANLMGNVTTNIYSKEGVDDMPTYPRRLGYCCSGVVTAVGAGVKSVKVGDPVACSWSVYSEIQNLPEENVIPLGNAPLRDGALFHIATFPLAAIRKCRLEIGESAIVMGMGVLGLTAVALLRTAGAAPVIAVDPDGQKRQKALAIGADYAFDPFEPDFAQKVKKLTCGVRVGIEVTGVGAGLNGILDCMGQYGRVALLGCTRTHDFTVDYYRKVHGPGITLVGAHTLARPKFESSPGWWTQHDDMVALRTLTEQGRLRLADMIDEVVSPADAVAVFDRLIREKTFPLVQFDWSRL